MATLGYFTQNKYIKILSLRLDFNCSEWDIWGCPLFFWIDALVTGVIVRILSIFCTNQTIKVRYWKFYISQISKLCNSEWGYTFYLFYINPLLYHKHPSSCAYLGPGCKGSSLSREAQTFLYPVTSSGLSCGALQAERYNLSSESWEN